MNDCVNGYARRLQAEIEEHSRSQAFFLEQVRSHHQTYMDALELTSEMVRVLSMLHLDGGPFLSICVEELEIELSICLLPVLVATPHYDELPCEYLIIAKCKTFESNFAGNLRLRRCSYLEAGLHQAVLAKLHTEPDEQSVESAMRGNVPVSSYTFEI